MNKSHHSTPKGKICPKNIPSLKLQISMGDNSPEEGSIESVDSSSQVDDPFSEEITMAALLADIVQ